MTIGSPPRPALERALSAPLRFSAETWSLLGVLLVAAAIRFWDLGSQALHHDESIHAQWAWKLVQGDYIHSPVFHGPFYYHFQGLVFLVFGATDYTSRVSAAITGVAIILLLLFLRRWLGSFGLVAAGVFLALSPTVVYYSRFFREDIYFAFFTLLIAVAMWRYLGGGRDRWLVVFAMAIAGAFTTKEAAFLTSAIFLLYLNGLIAADLAKATLEQRGTDSAGRRLMFAAALFPYAWAIVSIWPLIGRIREGAAWTSLPRGGDLLIIYGTLIVPLLAAFLKSPLESAGVFTEGAFDYPAVCQAGGTSLLRLAGVFAVLGSAAALIGLQWRPRIWAIAAGSAALLYLTLMTSFWTNLDGLCSGGWGSLDYWLAQQDVHRGNQPWFYYHMLMPSYEFLPLAVAAVGVWWAVVRGDAFSRFLVFWVVGMWLALSSAGEKMPWLNTHIALPTALLAGWTISRAWNAWTPRPPTRDALLALAGMGLVAAIAFWFVVFDSGDLATVASVAIRLVAGAAIVVALWFSIDRHGRQAVPALVVVTLVGALAFFSVQTMARTTYVRGDIPDDLLIYTQSSPDLAQIAGQIDELAEAAGLGYDLRIAVDSINSFSWPWAWYLRDYRAVRYEVMKDGPPEGQWDVLLVAFENAGIVNEKLAATAPGVYASPIRYPHRWWFDEKYKSALPDEARKFSTWRSLAEGVFDGDWLKTWFEFWRDKDPAFSPGSTDAFAYFPSNYDLEAGILGIRPLEVPEPFADADGRLTFGGVGGQPGQFFSPVDIAVDAAGNLYVIDSTTKRLSKFDSSGNVIASIDIREVPASGEASDPWGITVLGDGRVAVADTFGWRVRIFGEDLSLQSTFGQPPTMEGDPGPYELFGPRDTAIDALGRLWVTDTGHHRLMVYEGADNAFVMQVGDVQGSGAGQFSEPVGIDISPQGEVFVADMYNSRIQIVDLDGGYVGEIHVEGWGGSDPSDKPYLHVLSDGRVAVSLPLLNEVRIYSRAGVLEVSIAPAEEPLARPYGLAETDDGFLWIVEGEAARVRQFAIR